MVAGLLYVMFDCSKAFCTDDMFHTTSICRSSLWRDTQGGEPIGEQRMPLIDPLGYFLSLGEQRDIPLGANCDALIFTQIFHGHADAGFRVSQLIGNVDGSDHAFSIMQYQYGFQIVLSGGMNFHGGTYLLNEMLIFYYNTGGI